MMAKQVVYLLAIYSAAKEARLVHHKQEVQEANITSASCEGLAVSRGSSWMSLLTGDTIVWPNQLLHTSVDLDKKGTRRSGWLSRENEMCEDGKRWKRFGGGAKSRRRFASVLEVTRMPSLAGEVGEIEVGEGKRHPLTERTKVTRMPSLAGEVGEIEVVGEGNDILSLSV
jgi:hypothetical protein